MLQVQLWQLALATVAVGAVILKGTWHLSAKLTTLCNALGGIEDNGKRIDDLYERKAEKDQCGDRHKAFQVNQR